jgi:hypothetical protein
MKITRHRRARRVELTTGRITGLLNLDIQICVQFAFIAVGLCIGCLGWCKLPRPLFSQKPTIENNALSYLRRRKQEARLFSELGFAANSAANGSTELSGKSASRSASKHRSEGVKTG